MNQRSQPKKPPEGANFGLSSSLLKKGSESQNVGLSSSLLKKEYERAYSGLSSSLLKKESESANLGLSSSLLKKGSESQNLGLSSSLLKKEYEGAYSGLSSSLLKKESESANLGISSSLLKKGSESRNLGLSSSLLKKEPESAYLGLSPSLFKKESQSQSLPRPDQHIPMNASIITMLQQSAKGRDTSIMVVGYSGQAGESLDAIHKAVNKNHLAAGSTVVLHVSGQEQTMNVQDREAHLYALASMQMDLQEKGINVIIAGTSVSEDVLFSQANTPQNGLTPRRPQITSLAQASSYPGVIGTPKPFSQEDQKTSFEIALKALKERPLLDGNQLMTSLHDFIGPEGMQNRVKVLASNNSSLKTIAGRMGIPKENCGDLRAGGADVISEREQSATRSSLSPETDKSEILNKITRSNQLTLREKLVKDINNKFRKMILKILEHVSSMSIIRDDAGNENIEVNGKNKDKRNSMLSKDLPEPFNDMDEIIDVLNGNDEIYNRESKIGNLKKQVAKEKISEKDILFLEELNEFLYALANDKSPPEDLEADRLAFSKGVSKEEPLTPAFNALKVLENKMREALEQKM